MDPISITTFQLPVRVTSDRNGAYLADAAGGLVVFDVERDDRGSLTEIAATLNTLHACGLLVNAPLHD